jgi:hypothetical protein
MRPMAAALVLLTGVGGMAACGGASSGTPSGAARDAVPSDYAGVTPDPSKPAPPLALENPRGSRVSVGGEFLARHHMTGRMEYLVGSRAELQRVWADWNLAAGSHQGGDVSDAVDPVALVYGISGSGRITTLYPANFRPQQIVHDVPRLAGS